MSRCTPDCNVFVYQSDPPTIKCEIHGNITNECCLGCYNYAPNCNCDDDMSFE